MCVFECVVQACATCNMGLHDLFGLLVFSQAAQRDGKTRTRAKKFPFFLVSFVKGKTFQHLWQAAAKITTSCAATGPGWHQAGNWQLGTALISLAKWANKALAARGQPRGNTFYIPSGTVRVVQQFAVSSQVCFRFRWFRWFRFGFGLVRLLWQLSALVMYVIRGRQRETRIDLI